MKLNNLQEVVAHLDTIKAYIGDCCEAVPVCCDKNCVSDLGYSVSDLQYTVQSLQRQLDSLWSALSAHTGVGHLPAILDVGKLQKAIDTLGLGDSFEIQKKVIYSSEGKPSEYLFNFIPKTK
jgi:hypothetical protein